MEMIPTPVDESVGSYRPNGARTCSTAHTPAPHFSLFLCLTLCLVLSSWHCSMHTCWSPSQSLHIINRCLYCSLFCTPAHLLCIVHMVLPPHTRRYPATAFQAASVSTVVTIEPADNDGELLLRFDGSSGGVGTRAPAPPAPMAAPPTWVHHVPRVREVSNYALWLLRRPLSMHMSNAVHQCLRVVCLFSSLVCTSRIRMPQMPPSPPPPPPRSRSLPPCHDRIVLQCICRQTSLGFAPPSSLPLSSQTL